MVKGLKFQMRLRQRIECSLSDFLSNLNLNCISAAFIDMPKGFSKWFLFEIVFQNSGNCDQHVDM